MSYIEASSIEEQIKLENEENHKCYCCKCGFGYFKRDAEIAYTDIEYGSCHYPTTYSVWRKCPKCGKEQN